MNKREAKKLAWWRGAAILQNAIESGWETEDGLSEEDAVRFEAALAEVIKDMERKGR